MIRVTATVATMLIVVAAGALSPAQESAADRAVSGSDLERWQTELSNWGRWGPDDEIGTINLITPEKRREAAALVRAGVSVSLARDVLKEEAVDNPRPFVHTMHGVGSDEFAVRYHGWAHTHLDALAHVDDDEGRMYNGYRPDEAAVLEAGGHARNSIHNLKNGVFTRGILMDIPRLKGVPYLDPETPIYVEDLEAWEARAGVRAGAGDAVFIRTGRWAAREVLGPFIIGRIGTAAGLHASVIPWLKERDVALLGSDGALSVAPSDLPGAAHDFALVHLGIHLFDNADLEALGETAADQGRWEFLLTAAPLAVWGGTGSPINPIATF
jgi:kynurenine formamidase